MTRPSLPARSSSRLWGRLAPALLAALAATAAARGAIAGEPLGWAPPLRARLLAFSPGEKEAAGAGLVKVNPKGEIAIEPGHVLLVPIAPGDRAEVAGEADAVGLGSGAYEAPDVITWLPAPRGAARGAAGEGGETDETGETREVLVPAWSSARFLAVRGSKAAVSRVRVRVAAREAAPLAWYRFDDAIAEWITKEPSAPPPSPSMSEAAPAVRWLGAARSAMGEAARSPAGASWVMAKWLELAARLRPITEPYFSKRSVDIEGGRGSTELDEMDGMSELRVAVAGAKRSASRLTIHATSSDVVRIAIRARAAGPARVLVREGDFPVRVLVWETAPRGSGSSPRWTEPRWMRAVPPAESGGVITIDVLEGEVAVAAAAYGQRLGIGDWSAARRDRDLQLDRAQDAPRDAAEGRVIAALAEIERSGSADVAQKLVAQALGEKLSPALRALVEAEGSRFVRSPADAAGAAARAWRAVSKLPAGLSAPLLRSILERLAAVHSEPIRGAMPWSSIALSGTAGAADDLVAITTLGASLSPPLDGMRPLQARRAQAYAATHGELPDARKFARAAWTHEAPWRALAPRPGIVVRTSVTAPADIAGAASPQPLCTTEGPLGLRWTLLREPRDEIVVSSPPGTYAKVLVRGAGDNPEVESLISIDKVPVAVHAGAGLTSMVALSPGKHAIERPSGAPFVLARIPREGEAPCASLRDVVSWATSQPKRPVVFEVPGPGRETVARVVFSAPGKPSGVAQAVRVGAGARVFEAWIKDDATGAIEIPIPTGATELRVETSAPLLVRAEARLHDAPLSSSPLDAEATRLEELFAGPAGAGGRGPSAITLPPGSPAVVPLGILSRIPPLPLPNDMEALRRTRAGSGSLEPLGGAARTGSAADALLFAVLAARAENPQTAAAAEAFERIGVAHRSGAALARAASLWADAAIAGRDPSLSLRSYVAAQLALAEGADVSDVFDRLAPAIRWRARAGASASAASSIEVIPARPLSLSFEGPAVLRVRAQARARARERQALRWSILRAAGANDDAKATSPQEGEIKLYPSEGAATERLRAPANGDPRGGFVTEGRIAVRGAGAHVLHITSPGARALVQVELAAAEGLPRSRSAAPDAAPPAPRTPLGSLIEAPDRPAPDVAEDPPEGVFTLGAYALYEDGDVVEEDNASGVRYFELGAHAYRSIVTDRMWMGLRAFARLRGGAPSFGGELLTDFAPDGVVPGGYIHGRLVAQTPESAPAALGLRGAAGVMWSVPIWHSLALWPWASVTLLETDSAVMADPAADRDVYTQYAATHPLHAVLGAQLAVRPLVEGIARLGVSVRTSPLFEQIDRYDARLDVDVLAGRGIFPWIGFSWLLSVRPATSARTEPFVRDVATLSATFWRWLSRSQRLSLGADASYIFDVPAQGALGTPRFAGGVFLQYDYTGARGLRDFPPHRRPFQDRQEEGSERVERRRAGLDPAWAAPE